VRLVVDPGRGAARWALLVVGLALASGCTGDDGEGADPPASDRPADETTAPEDRPEPDLQEFCDAYDEFVEANQTELAVDEARVVAELAPPGTEEHLDLLVALLEAGEGSDPDGDLTGDMDYMEVVVAMRQPGPQLAQQRLYEILEEDCGRDVGIVIG
jgi:hypothetical protein